MTSESKSHKTQIVVAIIGATAIIVAAFINVFPKLFDKSSNLNLSKSSEISDKGISTSVVTTHNAQKTKFKIESLDSIQFDETSGLYSFEKFGYLSSKEKIVKGHSAAISFKYKPSDQKLPGNKSELYLPKLAVVLSNENKGKYRTEDGIVIYFPTDEEFIHFSSNNGVKFTSRTSGDRVFNSLKWHDVDIAIIKNTIELKIDSNLVFKQKVSLNPYDYYLNFSSWNSADFQMKNLRVKSPL